MCAVRFILGCLVQEMQRSLFLLSGMARLLGQWQLASPGSLFTARQVAASFLARMAQARPGERFTLHCPPVSLSEKARLSLLSQDMLHHHAQPQQPCNQLLMHRRSCGTPSGKHIQLAGLGAVPHVKRDMLCGVQAQAEQEPGLQAGEGWFDACAEGSQAAESRRSPAQRHSEYSACLGEAQYSAAAHALSFLCAVAPQASIPQESKQWNPSVCKDLLGL